jgi:hypothetical protein
MAGRCQPGGQAYAPFLEARLGTGALQQFVEGMDDGDREVRGVDHRHRGRRLLSVT